MLKRYLIFVVLLSLILAGCGGPRINRTPAIDNREEAMDVIHDEHVIVSLEQLLVRNNPVSWIKDANWDEYLFKFKPKSNVGEIIFISAQVRDIMGDLHTNEITRKALNISSKFLKKKYKKAGYKVKLGSGSTHASSVGISMALGTGYLAGSVTATGSIGTLTSVGVGVAVVVPALMISGLTKIVYNTKVNNRIQKRQTLAPIKIDRDGSLIDLFFPAVPIPQELVIEYSYNGINHEISFDLNRVTSNLHIK